MNDSLKDKFLVVAARAGDEQAFAKLYDKYADAIYRFLVFRVKAQEDALDLTAEVFLKIWEYLVRNDRKAIENIKAFLYRVASNLVADYYRQNGREMRFLDGAEWNQVVDQGYNLEDQVRQKEDVRRILEVMNKLGANERNLLIMRYLDDLEIKEMAAILDKTTGAVRVALHRAIKALKQLI